MDLGRVSIRANAEEMELIKNQYSNREGVRINEKSISFEDPNILSSGSKSVQEIPVSKIHTDVNRFQNRDAEYSEDSVKRIVDNYDPNKFDPVSVWKDPTDGKIYMLSGHSRLTAIKRLGIKTIPVKFFDGTEESAIRFAKVDANRGATAETLIEDIKAYKLSRDGGRGVQPLKKKELQERFPEYARLEFYTYLSPTGQFIRVLNDPKLYTEAPYIVMRSLWVGNWRRIYGAKFTDAHEDEFFKYFYIDPPTSGIPSKEDLEALVQKKFNRFDFNSEEPLLLKHGDTGTHARADTAPLEREKTALERENKALSLQLKAAHTQAEKLSITKDIQENLEKIERINRDLNIILKTQSALFGVNGLGKPSIRLEFLNNDELMAFQNLFQAAKKQGVNPNPENDPFIDEIKRLAEQSRRGGNETTNSKLRAEVYEIQKERDRLALKELGIEKLNGLGMLIDEMAGVTFNPEDINAYEGKGSYDYTPELDPYQPTYNLAKININAVIGKSSNRTIKHGKGGTRETLRTIQQTFQNGWTEMAKLAPLLKDPAGNTKQTLYNVWHFCKTHFNYHLDPPGHEVIRRPRRSWLDREAGIDCEDFAILISAILKNLGFTPEFRVVAFNGKPNYGHIFVYSNGYTLDGVMNLFDLRPNGITKEISIDVDSKQVRPVLGAAAFSDLGMTPKKAGKKIIWKSPLTAKLAAEQTALLSKPNPNAADARKLLWLINMDGNPDYQRIALRLSPMLNILPDGNIQTKQGISMVELSELAGLIALKERGGIDTKTIEGIELSEEIDGLCNEFVACVNDVDAIGRPKWMDKIRNGFKKMGQKLKDFGHTLKEEGKKFLKNPLRYAAIVLMKINPLFILGRATFLLLLRFNLFNIAHKLGNGLMTDEQARAAKLSPEAHAAAKKAWQKFSNVWELPFGGSKEALERTVRKGSKVPAMASPKDLTAEHKAIADKEGGIKGGQDSDYAVDFIGWALAEENVGALPVVAPAIAAASGMIASAVSIVGKVTGAVEKVKETVDTVKDTIDTAKNIVKGKKSEPDDEDDEDLEGVDLLEEYLSGLFDEQLEGLGRLTKAERQARRAERKEKRKAKKSKRKLTKAEKKAKRKKKFKELKDKIVGMVSPLTEKLGLTKKESAEESGFASEDEKVQFLKTQNSEKSTDDGAGGGGSGSETTSGSNNTMLIVLGVAVVGGGIMMAKM